MFEPCRNYYCGWTQSTSPQFVGGLSQVEQGFIHASWWRMLSFFRSFTFFAWLRQSCPKRGSNSVLVSAHCSRLQRCVSRLTVGEGLGVSEVGERFQVASLSFCQPIVDSQPQ